MPFGAVRGSWFVGGSRRFAGGRNNPKRRVLRLVGGSWAVRVDLRAGRNNPKRCVLRFISGKCILFLGI